MSPQDHPTTPLGDSATAMHELFITLCEQGFTEWQALRLIGVVIAESMRNGMTDG